MNLQRTNFPTHINGEEIISVVQGKKFMNRSATFQGMLDRNEYLFNEEDNRYHLGLLSSWGMQGRESYPMITKLLERGTELKVKGFFGEFTYDKPFYDPRPGMRTLASTRDEAGDYPGIDESDFDIILSEKCYPGEIIGTDPYGDEDQLYVISSEASELNGEGWRTTVTLTTTSSSASYNPSLLESNISYFKINHIGSEYNTTFAGVELPTGQPTGVLRARFKLGGIRGIEGYVTGFADAINSGLNAVDGKDVESERAMAALRDRYANGDNTANTVIFGDKQDVPNLRASSLMEFLVERTLMKRTATSHMWQRQGQIRNTNGAITYLNEGAWHQLRRGKIITIPKVMGITKAHIAEAVNFAYRNNPALPWEEREIVFEGGKLAEQNLLLIFQNEIQQQLTVLMQGNFFATLFGADGLLPESLKTSLVGGNSLNELEIKSLLRFVSVPLLGIAGKVTIKYNSALDHFAGTPLEHRSQLPGGYDWTSHSLIIWDVRSQEYSNNAKNIQGASDETDVRIKDNLYLVRPEEGMVYKGSENGRWDGGKTSNIVSSSRMIGQGFWAFNSSAVWMPYPENVVMIELSKGARRSGYTNTMYSNTVFG